MTRAVQLVKCTRVHVGVGQEIPQLDAFSVVVQNPEALVTEETWVTRSKRVIGGQPSGKSSSGMQLSTFTCTWVFPLYVTTFLLDNTSATNKTLTQDKQRSP